MKEKHIRQSKVLNQECVGGIGEIPKEISMAGAPLGKETVVEKLVGKVANSLAVWSL